MKLLLLPIILLFASCAATSEFLNKNESASKLAVQAATLEFIDDDLGKAVRVEAVTSEIILTLNGGERTTIEALGTYARKKVAEGDLNAQERLLANALIEAIQDELQRRLKQDLISKENRVQLISVIQWAKEAATVTLDTVRHTK